MKTKLKNYLFSIKSILLDVIRSQTGKYFFIKSVKEKPLRIIIGSSGVTQSNWIPSEASYLNLLKENQWSTYFLENQIDALLAEHVWEHLSEAEGFLAAKTCFKYLKRGGYLRVAVPDGFFPDEKYIDRVKPAENGHGTKGHMILYTYKTLSNIFEKAGFSIDLLEYFDEEGIFHYQEWKKDDGMVQRSKNFDKRNIGEKLNYTSLILDAKKQ